MASFVNPTLPSGKQTKNYGRSPFLMRKSTISKAVFNSKLLNYQRVMISLGLMVWNWDISQSVDLSLGHNYGWGHHDHHIWLLDEHSLYNPFRHQIATSGSSCSCRMSAMLSPCCQDFSQQLSRASGAAMVQKFTDDVHEMCKGICPKKIWLYMVQ